MNLQPCWDYQYNPCWGTFARLIVAPTIDWPPEFILCAWVRGKKSGKCFRYRLDPLQEEGSMTRAHWSRYRCNGKRTRCFRLNEGCWSKILFNFFSSDQKETEFSSEICFSGSLNDCLQKYTISNMVVLAAYVYWNLTCFYLWRPQGIIIDLKASTFSSTKGIETREYDELWSEVQRLNWAALANLSPCVRWGLRFDILIRVKND